MSLPIGVDAETLVCGKEDRDTHMQVIGASGVGKSYFLESMVRYDIMRGRGVCLIDPHGEMYNNLVTWLACYGYKTNQVHLINPTKNEYSVGFNPLALDREPSRCVSDMINAITRVWGGNDMSDTPRLKKCLRLTLYALAHHRLSLLNANIFTSTRFKTLRQRLVSELPIEEYRDEWAEFDTYGDREYREYFESTRSRLLEFVTSPAIRPIIGQTENVLDFGQCMDKGHIVLVNLAESGSFHKQEAQLLGALITAEMYSCAKQRKVGWAKAHPFYAVLDECASFINDDIANSLDETRKFGLHFILSHQRLQQLKNVSDNCYDAVMANAQAKVVFRVNDDENAEVLCTQLFRSEFDLERPKEILSKPVAVGQEIITLFSESETHTSGTNSTAMDGSGSSRSSGSSENMSESVFTPTVGDIPGVFSGVSSGQVSGSAEQRFTASSEGKSDSIGYTTGSSQSLRTVYEVMPSATYSLEEIKHLGIRSIRELPNRTAFVVLPNQKPRRIQTLDVKGFSPLPGIIERTTTRLYERSQYAKSQ
ncbi:MAG: type IV secretion system DNA-binding domain-containing protein, partial [Pseudomonadota bacterium]